MSKEPSVEQQCKLRGGVFDPKNNSCKINTLSVEDQIDAVINTFNGVAKSLQYLRPYLIKYAVIPFRFDIEGSAHYMNMKNVRDRDKFMRHLYAALEEDIKDGIITREEEDKVLQYVSESAASPHSLPDELRNKGLPSYLIHLVEQSIHSDIDCTLYFRPEDNATKLEFALYNDKTVYDDREVPVWVEVSEIASEYTRPFPVYIKFGHEEEI